MIFEADDKTAPEAKIIPKKPEGNKVKKIVKFLKGKKVVKRVCGNGYAYDPKHKRCVKVAPSELRKRALGAKKRVRKMRVKMGLILRKRAKSMKIRNARMGSK